jgi:O-antigen/teichoic acid export membrane protein
MYMLRGAGRPREIAVQTILPPLATLLIAGLLALLRPTIELGLMMLAVGCGYLVTHLWTAFRFDVWNQRDLRGERSVLLRMQRGTGLPIYQGALVSVGVSELIVVLAGASIGTIAFGQFSLAVSLAAPLATLPTVIGMVQFRNFGARNSLPKRLLISATLRSALLGLAGVCAGWVTFPVIFPRGFEDARIMFPVLAAGFLVHGLGDYLNQFLQAQGDGVRIKRAAYGVGATNIIVGVVAIPFFGVWGLVATRLVGSSTYAASMALLTRRRNRAD